MNFSPTATSTTIAITAAAIIPHGKPRVSSYFGRSPVLITLWGAPAGTQSIAPFSNGSLAPLMTATPSPFTAYKS